MKYFLSFSGRILCFLIFFILMVTAVPMTNVQAESFRIAQERDTDILPFDDPTGFDIEDPSYQGGDELGADAGAEQIVGTLNTIITFLKYLAGIIAFSWLVWSGIRMVSAGDKEDQAKAAQQGAIYSVVALLFIVLVEPLITNSLYGGGAIDPAGQLADRESIEIAIESGRAEIRAIVEWVEAILIFLGVGYLLFSAWRFLQDLGGEEEISKQKTVLSAMAIGFFVTALDQILIEEVFYKTVLGDDTVVRFEQNATRGIQEIVGILNYVLQFLAVVSVLLLVYGGLLLITSFSSEENTEKAKKIITGAGIGFLMILTSYIMVNAVIMGSVF